MFSRLPESNARRQGSAGGFTASTVVHVVLMALAVRATAWTAPARTTIEPVKLMYVEPPHTPPAPTAPMPPSGGAVSRSDTPLPPPPSPPIGAIDDISPALPPPGAMDQIIRATEFRPTSADALGDHTRRAVPNVSAGGAFPEELVDRAIVAIPGTTTPRYPPSLQTAGLEGDVRARFVVDTLGRVEPASVRILDSTHDLFARAVRDALARARFRPAEAHGHRVRQLAEQAFTFRLPDER